MKNIFTLLFLLFSFALPAQDYFSIRNGCNFLGVETGAEYYSFEPTGEAALIVKKILDAAGALSHSSIIVKESNVQNAVATTLDNRRYILYSTVFLEKFKGDAKTKWAAYTVLAHEIGHHLNGHDFGEKDPRRRKQMELEADKFAGAVCRTLGATLQESIAGMESIPLEGETATHPAKSARTAAVANGWKVQEEVLKSRGDVGSSEMKEAVESISGKISQTYGGFEVALLSVRHDGSVFFTFSLKNLNKTDKDVTLFLEANGMRTSIQDYDEYYKAFQIFLENQASVNGYLKTRVAEGSFATAKVQFSRSISSLKTIPEIRLLIQIGGEGLPKALVFRNIPIPYEMKK